MNEHATTDWAIEQLRGVFPLPAAVPADPVETLVQTILSQNTTDTNRDRAYHSLRSRFPSLDAIADADPAEIAASIRAGGLHHQKAIRIRDVLRRIRTERGAFDLSFLGDLPPATGMGWLLASPGIGRKTASIVLLFSFGLPVFPVDTHVARTTRRIGWVRPGEDPHRRMNEILPPDPKRMADLHLLLIELGRRLCRPRRPACASCPLRDRCRTGRRSGRPP